MPRSLTHGELIIESSDQSGGTKQRPPEAYAAILGQLSKTPLRPELYSRVQYQLLARYLTATAGYAQPLSNGELGGTDEFIHVVVHTISHGAQEEREDFTAGKGLQRFIDWQPQTAANQVLFVRGSLSPPWISAIGTKYKIDPEFFRRHLRYLPGPDYADLPPLPSASTEVLTLTVPSLYNRLQALGPIEVGKARGKDADVAKKNQQLICGELTCGETVVRRYSTLDDRLFSVEHEISIFTRNKKNGGQIAVVLLDNGRDMNRAGGPPCFGRQDSMVRKTPMDGVRLVPLILPRPPTVNINIAHGGVPASVDPPSMTSICHVVSLLPFYFGISVDKASFDADIFAALSEIFSLVAAAECQFLNRLQVIAQDHQLHIAESEHMMLALSTLRYIKTLSDDHKHRLQQSLRFLKTCSSKINAKTHTIEINVASSHTDDQPRTNALEIILIDFEELIARAKNLSTLCTEGVDSIMNNAMLLESQKAIRKADDQRRLTLLAYLFLPLSLVTSLFGMNVKELGTGSQNIWLPFVVLIPVLLISWILSYPHKITQFFTYSKASILWQARHHQPHVATNSVKTSWDKGTRSV